jgi:hypothetical protein
MLRISELIVTQNCLRSFYKTKAIAANLSTGTWFKEPITITRTEDEELYLWNGHTRAFACHLAGIDTLPLGKYIITRMTYKQLASINFQVGYVTPFCPKLWCRKADFFPYKAKVMDLYTNLGYRSAIKYVLTHEDDYLEARSVTHIEDMEYLENS